MANLKKDISAFSSKGYVLASVVLLLITLANFVLINIVFINSKSITDNNMKAVRQMNTINSELANVNRNALMIAGNIGDPYAAVSNIENSFRIIEANEAAYEKIKNRSDIEIKRYNQSKLLLEAYHQKLFAIRDTFRSIPPEGRREIYLQELHPLQITATEMFLAASELNDKNADDLVHRNSIIHGISIDLMIFLLAVGEIAIFLLGKRAKKSHQELLRRQHEIEVAGEKLQLSKDRMTDLARMNLLTNMKNRYALEDELSSRLETDQFNIGVFDIDNFRNINDLYGYAFGDEYLAAIGEALNNEFSDVARIYNITGNEFCFVFNDDVPDSQAQKIAEKIRTVISKPYTILNISVQSSVSGSIYHYLPNDCLNVSALLIKMDTAVHNVKRNGGNSVITVNNL